MPAKKKKAVPYLPSIGKVFQTALVWWQIADLTIPTDFCTPALKLYDLIVFIHFWL